jgi:hypothetical protein
MDPGGLRIHDDCDPVIGDRQLDEGDGGLMARLDLGSPDWSRCGTDVDLAAAELMETAAGARDAEHNGDAGVG